MPRSSLKNLSRLISAVAKELPPEQTFLADLKKSMEVTAGKEAGIPSKAYSPSGMNCIRSMYYKMIGTIPDPMPQSYSSIGICDMGTDIHVRVQTAIDKMKDNGIQCEYIDVAEFVRSRNLPLEIVSKQGMETKLFSPQYNMRFLCDGIIKYNNHYYILEIKTESSFKWTSRTDVDPSHYNQATAYSIVMQLPEVLFVYVNRDIFDFKSYIFTPTDEQKANFVGQIENCNEYVTMHKCPPKPEDASKKTCSYCIYRDTCNREI